jgi:hypothetical protein
VADVLLDELVHLDGVPVGVEAAEEAIHRAGGGVEYRHAHVNSQSVYIQTIYISKFATPLPMLDRNSILLITAWLLSLLCPASAHTVELTDMDYHLGRMFWAVFIAAVLGFFVYLFCAYMPPDAPPPPPMPISLELLASTAAALRPLFGANGTTDKEVTKKNKRVVAHAYDLLRECGSLLSRAEYAAARHAHLKERQRERRKLDEESSKIKLSDAVHTITGGYTGNHAPRYFRMFLEVFYGEVLAEEESPLPVAELSRPPFPPTYFEENGEWKQRKEGNYKQWATWTYERYQVHGLRKDEVTYLTGKFTELAKKGYLGKSTQGRCSPTKAKEPKTKG